MSGILIMVDASYLVALCQAGEWDVVLFSLTPLLFAQILIRRLLPAPDSPKAAELPSPAP